MADYRSLVIVSGVTRQLVDTDRLIAGSGITSAPSQNLAIDAPSGQNVTIGATTAASVGIGSATAAVNVGGLLNANTIDRAAAGALSIGATTATSVGIGSASAPVNVGGILNANTIDRATAGVLSIGATNATGITLGKAGVAVTASGGVLTNNLDQAIAGSLTIGTTTATGITIGKAGVGASVPGGVATTSITRSSAGTLTIGTDANTTALTIGSVGVLTTVAGNLQVNGTETVIGLSTFTGDAQFDGNVVFGNATTDLVSFRSTIGNGTYNDLAFSTGNPHQIYVVDTTAVDTVGYGFVIRCGAAGAASAAPGVSGGQASFTGGVGSAGSGTFAAGPGGLISIVGGAGGADGGAGGAAGGLVQLRGGAATGTATGGNVRLAGGAGTVKGSVLVGFQNTASVLLGNATDSTTITQVGAGDVTFNGQLFLGLDVTFVNTVDHNILVNDTTTVDAIGRYINIEGGNGGAASVTGGGRGGDASLLGGSGGAGTAALASGAGADAWLGAGDAGAANSGPGNAGGVCYVQAGNSHGAGQLGGNVRVWAGNSDAGGSTMGLVQVGRARSIDIGYQDSLAITLGNATNNTTIAQVGTGSVTFNGQLFLGLNVTFANAVNHEIKVTDTATVDTSGKGIWMYAGAAGAASTANALPGGAIDITGGVGGAGSATFTAGPGGNVNLDGGNAGAAAAGGGNYGGNIIIRGGNGTGTVKGGDVYLAGGNGTTDGDVWLGYQNTAGVYLGNTTDNTPITQQGSGLVTLNGVVRLNNTVLRLGETSTPAAVGNNGFLYTKDVSGIAELFWRDDTNAELQVTTNGQLNVTASTSAPKVVFTGTARATISAGAPVCLNYDGANNGVFNADANGTGTGTQRCIGLADAATTAGNPAYVVTAGAKATADAIWDAVPATTDVGKPAYLSENVGKLTLTAPSTIGSVVQVVGIISVGGTGNVAVLVQPQAPVLL